MQEFWLWIGIERSVSVPINVLQMRIWIDRRVKGLGRFEAVLFGLAPLWIGTNLDMDKIKK